MKKIIVLFSMLILVTATVNAQELNAQITVNSDRIQGTNKGVFTSLQKALTSFLNTQKWSGTTFALNEKIDCTFTLTIMTNPSDNYFTAELLVQARRPVYNSSYTTNLINFRDVDLDFEYLENSSIEYINNNINTNLIATMAFYANLILGLDFDSFSPLGGSVFYREAQSIAMQAQAFPSWKGWTAFDKNNNRYGMITAFMDESLKGYRNFWYTYHRKGLDEMAANPDRGRTTILNSLSVLDDIRSIRSSSVILQMFADSKLDEVVALSSKATPEEKKSTYDLFWKIYPTMSNKLGPLKK